MTDVFLSSVSNAQSDSEGCDFSALLKRCLSCVVGSQTPPCLPSPCHDDGEGLNEVDTPTNNAKRKSRHQKETELTLALVGPLESPEERETRERKESTKIFQVQYLTLHFLSSNTDQYLCHRSY